MRPPLAPPRLSEWRYDDAAAHAVETSWLTVRPASAICCLDGRDGLRRRGVRRGRDRVLPEELLRGDLGAEVAGDRAHVAVGQLEPRAGEGVGELVRVLQEAAGDGLVGRVHPQRQVGGQHGRPALGAALVGRRDDRLGVLGDPLAGAARALLQLPLVLEEDLEEAVAPLGRDIGPGDLEARGDGVLADTGAVLVEPAHAAGLDRGCLRLGADVLTGVGRTVGLAEGVATGDERHGLLVVHRHPAERVADVVRGQDRVGVALRALGVDVDEAHLDRGERVVELAVAGVALLATAVAAEPLGLGAPVDVVVRLPRVDAATGEAEGLEAHVLERDVAGEDDQVGPRQGVAVLLLHRPQQAASLVEVAVVGPGVEGGEALLAGATAAAAVLDAVGAGAVPGHPDHQRAVVAEVGGPPVLAVLQHRGDVGLDRAEVEGLERGGVVELLAERVQHRLVLREDLQVEALGPPGAVGVALGRVHEPVVEDRTAAARGGVLVHLADLGVGVVLVGGVDRTRGVVGQVVGQVVGHGVPLQLLRTVDGSGAEAHWGHRPQ